MARSSCDHSYSLHNLYGSVMVHDTGHPIMYHLDAFGEAPGYVSGSREGIWWLPTSSTRDYLILTNQSNHSLQGTLWLYDASGKSSNQPVQLAPRQTERLSVRELLAKAGLQGMYGGIKVEVPNGAGSLDSAHILFDETAGFSATMKMFDYNPQAQIAERDFARTSLWTTRAPMLALSSPDPVLAFPNGVCSQQTSTITVPPQVLIQMMYAEANGTNPTAMQSLGETIENRFSSIYFTNTFNTWQNSLIPSQVALNTTITTGVEPELDAAVNVFTDKTGGWCSALAWWSPTATQWSTVQSAIGSGTATFPGNTGAPTYSTWPTSSQQILYVPSVGTKSGGVPNFLYLAPRTSSQAAAVSTSCN
jgi:hypothetical protein